MKVCWIANQASPYKMKLLNILGKSIDLHVFLYDDKSEIRGSRWYNYTNDTFSLSIIDNHFFKNIWYISKKYDVLIDSMYSTRYGMIANLFFKMHNKITILQADGGIAIDRGPIINSSISLLMKMHDYYLSSSAVTDTYFKYYGIDDKKIRHFRFSSLTNYDLQINHKMRGNIHKNRPFRLISVGQPIYRKGFDILVQVFNELRDLDINLQIIGGNPQEDVLDYVEKNNVSNIEFIGNLDKDELIKYYSNSDMFILCTREDIWGLVINEAMSFGLPVLTTDKCVAGIHFNQICKSVFINNVNDINGYIEKIKKIYDLDSEEYINMCKDSIKVISEYSIENSAEDILLNLEEIKKVLY